MIQSITFGVLAAIGLIFLTGCGSNPANAVNPHAPPGTGFILNDYTLPNGKTKKCTIFVPLKYDKTKSWPTIVFLQGLGEGGGDGVKNTTVGLGPNIAKHYNDFDFIAVFPQSSGGTWGSDDQQQMALSCLDQTEARYNVDKKRVILTGLSTGGWGTWAIGAKNADRFAALVPCCAHNGEEFADRLTHMPIWAFHNSGDPFVWAGSTKDTVSKINKLGGSAKMTIYGDIGHNCWDQAYNNPDVLAWMRAQHR